VPPVHPDVLHAARVIYNYHYLAHVPIRAEVIIALGTNDLRVAEFASDLFHQGFGGWLLCTGGIAHKADLLATPWTKSEAEMYSDIAVERGVPRAQIILETQATNTAENVRFSRQLLAKNAIKPRNIVIAVKPFMQRRVWATLAVEWPEMPATVASPQFTLDEYFTPELPAEKMIHILMGDLQRLWVYARKGWSAPQRLPTEVMAAFRYLKSAGWTHHLIPGEADA
jgi:DUF218 domain